MSETPDWQLRFTAPSVGFPSWSSGAPNRVAFVSNERGSWQGWALNLTTGARRRVTDEPIGVEQVLVAPDGRIVWWQDPVGDERGRWMAVAFDGGEPKRFTPDIVDGWSAGISFAGATAAVGVCTREDYRVYVVGSGRASVLVHADERPLGVG